MLVVSTLPDIRALGLPDSSAILWLALFDIYLYLREKHKVVGRSRADQLSAITLICPLSTHPQELFTPKWVNLLIVTLLLSDLLLPWVPPCVKWNGSLKITALKYVEGESEENKIFEAKHGPPATTALSLLMSFVFLLFLTRQSALKWEVKNPFI